MCISSEEKINNSIHMFHLVSNMPYRFWIFNESLKSVKVMVQRANVCCKGLHKAVVYPPNFILKNIDRFKQVGEDPS